MGKANLPLRFVAIAFSYWDTSGRSGRRPLGRILRESRSCTSLPKSDADRVRQVPPETTDRLVAHRYWRSLPPVSSGKFTTMMEMSFNRDVISEKAFIKNSDREKPNRGECTVGIPYRNGAQLTQGQTHNPIVFDSD